MTVGYSDAIKASVLQLIASAVDSGAGPGRMRIYGGTRPMHTGDPTTETAIVVLVFLKPSAGTPVTGALPLRFVSPTTITHTGDPTWARLEDANGLAHADLDIGISLPGSTADLIIDVGRWYEGGEVTTNSISLVI